MFDYDVANHLVQTTQGLTSLGQYDYNAQGMRVRHYGSERGDVSYYYDDGAVLEEYVDGAGGGLLAHYRYGDRLLSLDAPGDGGVQYYHHDALGSTVNLSDSLGATKVSYTLDPWGHIRNQQGESVNRQIFTGQEHDQQTGLIYFGARYYDPDSARFISQDSYLGEAGTPPSLNRYLYAYSNPTVYVDLMGYESVSTDDDNSVYWNVEKDWVGPYNPTSNRHRIGVRDGDTVKLTVEMGGGEVGYENLETAANDYFGRELKSVMDQSDISGLDPQRQFGDIKYYVDDTLNPNNEARISATPKDSYLKRSGDQLIKGNYSDEVTALGTAGQMATGLLGIDLPGDVRDLNYDLTNWENSWGHAGQTALDAVGLFPLIGVLKNVDEVAALARHSTKDVSALSGVIDPSCVRFTQDSIGSMFKNGQSIDDVAKQLRRVDGDGLARQFPPIRLVEKDGVMYTLDNRRLATFSAGGKNVPYRMATPKEIADEWSKKFTTTAEQGMGKFITVRQQRGQ